MSLLCDSFAGAFSHLGVERIDLQCTADNVASARIAERLGFQLEGHQRQRHRKRDGELVDRLWYGLLRSEWEAQPRDSVPRGGPGESEAARKGKAA
jgi:RimJ/RimL family protein N-acetyltransferase